MLRKGISKFRLLAMLHFGSFRNAFRSFNKMKSRDLYKCFSQWCMKPSKLIAEFRKRPAIPNNRTISEISPQQTWMIGEITKKLLKHEIRLLEKVLENNLQNIVKREYLEFSINLQKMQETATRVQELALNNKDIYLKSKYIDIYVATSMRHQWEYQETNYFIKKVLKNKMIRNLNICYFDPTQTLCKNRLDKGLIEALMLKRACCTIYMAQERDTLGKDSELAATLVQGKPVIAFVPKINHNHYCNKIRKRPLHFFQQRYFLLKSRNLFGKNSGFDRLAQKYGLDGPECEKLLDEFYDILEVHQKKYPFLLWFKKDEEFKQDHRKLFANICKIITLADWYNFDHRAKLLRDIHPLGIQADLTTGVANGILVARNYSDCVKLLYGLLTNNLRFTIKKREGVTILEEEITKSPFRVVTDDRVLTNAFWKDYF